MTFTIEDIKRLIPEASKIRDHGKGDIVFYLSSRPFHSFYGSGELLLTTRRQLEILQETLRQVDAIALSNPAGYYEPGQYDRNDDRPEDVTAFNASEIHTIILEAFESIKKVGES